MAHIYVFSPCSAVLDKASFRRGVARLKALGHAVEVDEAALARSMRFAGDDATRLAAIGRAAASGADIAMISRGGYGLTRILPDLPYKAVARSIEKGMRWVGSSDFTALQQALLAKNGAVTWQGPCVIEDFGVNYDPTAQPDDIMEACFDDLVQGIGEGAGWRMPVQRKPVAAAPGASNAIKSIAAYAHKISAKQDFDIKTATLWGGNLSVLVSLLGTPYFPNIKGGVLFMEDVGAYPYQIERMLTQLLRAGVLGQQKAVVMGQFTRYVPTAQDGGFKLQTVVDWLVAQIKAPVLSGLPFGHVPTKVCLPVGARVNLNVQGRDALMYWG